MKNKSWNPDHYLKQGATPEEAQRLAKEASLNANSINRSKGKTVSWRSKSYWLNKGYAENEVDAILNFDLKRFDKAECERLFGDRGDMIYEVRQECLKRQPRCSPFSREFWMNKGYSLEDADFKRNSMRPIRKEYWMAQGYSEQDAIIKALETKDSNNKKGAKKAASRPKEDIRKNNHRCIEYYVERGYSKTEAEQMLSDHQVWFSLDICVAKHGPIQGYQVWLDRQNKWQETLKSKSADEIKDMNKKKNAYRLDLFETVDHAIDALNSKRGMTLVKTWEEFDQVVQYKIDSGFFHTTESYFYDLQVPKIQKEILNMTFESFSQRYGHLFYSLPSDLKIKANWQRKTKKTMEGYLRSSLEIYFYDMFFKNKLNDLYEIQIDKRYPDSSFRFDFGLTCKNSSSTIYIEICPMILHTGYELYSEKMLKKQKLFNCILLATKAEVDQFIKGIR